MNRLLTPRRQDDATENERWSAGTGSISSSGGGLRKALLGIGVVGAALVASRLLRRLGTSQSPGRPAQRPRDAGPGDVRPNEGRRAFAGDETAGETAEAGEPAESTTDDEGLPGEDRSPTEIEERAVDDAQEEPAEPGEMTVDDDIAEDVVDEGVTDETDGDEEERG